MQKIIRNIWQQEIGAAFCRARILRHEIHPEGLDVYRLLFFSAGSFAPESRLGHILSILRGKGELRIPANEPLYLKPGVHLYIPPGEACIFAMEQWSELLCVSAPCPGQARGERLLLRDELFLSACASGSESLRWILTPQYLSRRIFLHHDRTLLSKSGNPVSWFRTTMFDVAGLPVNREGEPVFKMSYNSRTEFNVCYDVKGTARVRMALHPYEEQNQNWGPWLPLDGEATYQLNETAGSRRNKHEVHIIDGYVTLFCMFDPAPTGTEKHQPGAYSDYEPLSNVLGTGGYEIYRREIAKYDEMVDLLSTAKAAGNLLTMRNTPYWELYLKGRGAQWMIEDELAKTLASEGKGREKVIAQWMQAFIQPGEWRRVAVKEIIPASSHPEMEKLQ